MLLVFDLLSFDLPLKIIHCFDVGDIGWFDQQIISLWISSNELRYSRDQCSFSNLLLYCSIRIVKTWWLTWDYRCRNEEDRSVSVGKASKPATSNERNFSGETRSTTYGSGVLRSSLLVGYSRARHVRTWRNNRFVNGRRRTGNRPVVVVDRRFHFADHSFLALIVPRRHLSLGDVSLSNPTIAEISPSLHQIKSSTYPSLEDLDVIIAGNGF